MVWPIEDHGAAVRPMATRESHPLIEQRLAVCQKCQSREHMDCVGTWDNEQKLDLLARAEFHCPLRKW